jgi:hypothetical protein
MDRATIAHRHLTSLGSHVVGLSIAIPVIIIWWLAFYGSQKLYDYSQTIKKSKEGASFVALAKGFQLLAIYLPVRVVVRTIFVILEQSHPSITHAATVVIIYLNIIFPLVAFMLISWAARQLSLIAKARTSFAGLNILVLIFSALSIVYSYVSFMGSSRAASANWLLTSEYGIPLPMRMFTIMIPCLFIWFVGFLAIYHIYLYQRYVKGIVYKQLLNGLTTGLSLVVFISIALQFLTLSAASLQQLRFSSVLVLAYLVLFAAGLAFVQVALGVRRLKLLDEV